MILIVNANFFNSIIGLHTNTFYCVEHPFGFRKVNVKLYGEILVKINEPYRHTLENLRILLRTR
jgi:hypothetical protein